MSEEASTTELLNKIKDAKSLDDAILAGGGCVPALGEYLSRLLEKKGLVRSQVVKAADMDATFGFQIFKGERGASRDKVLSLCFAMGCDLKETNRALKISGANELYSKSKRDVIIIYALENGWSLHDCNDALYKNSEKTIS